LIHPQRPSHCLWGFSVLVCSTWMTIFTARDWPSHASIEDGNYWKPTISSTRLHLDSNYMLFKLVCCSRCMRSCRRVATKRHMVSGFIRERLRYVRTHSQAHDKHLTLLVGEDRRSGRTASKHLQRFRPGYTMAPICPNRVT
jgi:hypothetical protein